DPLLAQFCNDPPGDVWRRDPADAIAGVMANRDSLRLARLQTAAARESGQDVLARIEDLQAGRIQSQLPFDGRVLQIRAFAHLPDELLTKDMVNLRNVAPEPLRQLRGLVGAFEAAIPADPRALQAAILELESNAWVAAFDRIEVPSVMPHPIDEKQPAGAIPADVGVLAFCQDGNALHVALCTRQKSTYWTVKNSARVGTQVGQLVREIGGVASRGGRLPDKDQWRDLAIELRDRLIMPGTGTILEGPLAGVKHLVIVPDGLLWYLPFDLLPVEDRDSKFLGDSIQISYAATPALAMFPTGAEATKPEVALTAGQFFALRDSEVNQSVIQSIIDALPAGQCLRLPEDDASPTGQLGSKIGHLVVADAVTPVPGRSADLMLARYEVGKQGKGLRGWLQFPGVVPRSVFLAGFRSNLVTNETVSGAELAHTLALLQYAGVRDVIVSRWAVGGESTGTLLREYAQELPFLGPQGAFQRAKTVLRRSELVPSAEPTLIGKDLDRETVAGDEPFFWAGYLHAAPLPAPQRGP
ncbi:MAG: CHAT domain-containing protein, partial [Planctomycetota bacterium]